MGYWGHRAKDGDQPLDLLGAAEKSAKTAVAFVNDYFKKAKENDDLYAWAGLVTLLVEKGKKFSQKVYKDAFKAVECSEDKQFFSALIDGKPAPVKKEHKVFVEITVNAFDEEGALEKAEERLSLFSGTLKRHKESNWDKVKVSVNA